MSQIILGYLCAIYSAVVSMILMGLLFGIQGEIIGMTAFIGLIISVPYTIIQSTIIISISEYMSFRHPVYYIVCGMLCGVIAVAALFGGWLPDPLLWRMVIIAGAAGGLVYWLIAGRYAGGKSEGNSA